MTEYEALLRDAVKGMFEARDRLGRLRRATAEANGTKMPNELWLSSVTAAMEAVTSEGCAYLQVVFGLRRLAADVEANRSN